eukprot:9086138-Lingulodinium_polyedra.AAC.1
MGPLKSKTRISPRVPNGSHERRVRGPSRGCLRRINVQKRQPQIVANACNSLSPPHASGPGLL